MDDHVLLHVVPMGCGFEKLSLSTKKTHNTSLSAKYDEGLEVGFHLAINESLMKRASHQDDDNYDVITVIQLHHQFDLRSFSARNCPATLIKFMFDPAQKCVLLRCMVDSTVKQDPSDRFSSWDYTTNGGSRPSPVNGGVKVCRFCDDAIICIGAIRLQLVWANPEVQPGDERWKVLRRSAKIGSRNRRDIEGQQHAECPPTTVATSRNTHQPITKQNILSEGREFIADGALQTRVFKVKTNRKRLEFIALKEIRDFSKEAAKAQKEIAEYVRIGHHKHIVRYLGHHIPPFSQQNATPLGPVEIYMDLYDGDLNFFNNEGHFKGSNLHVTMLHQILLALKFLADKSICHRDVKPKNILYRRRQGQQCHFALADMDAARVMGKGNSEVGTTQFMAPEICDMERDAKPIMDIWSLAVTLMEIHPNKPFELLTVESYNKNQVREKVVEFGRSFPGYQPMTEVEPEKRASAESLLHSLFNGEGLTVRRSARTGKTRAEARAQPRRFLR